MISQKSRSTDNESSFVTMRCESGISHPVELGIFTGIHMDGCQTLPLRFRWMLEWTLTIFALGILTRSASRWHQRPKPCARGSRAIGEMKSPTPRSYRLRVVHLPSASFGFPVFCSTVFFNL